MSGLQDHQARYQANQRAARAYVARIAFIVDAIEGAIAMGCDPRQCPGVAALEPGPAPLPGGGCERCPSRRAQQGPAPGAGGRS
jgi:hypothetical protein